jgi:hypothetical protein
MTKILLMAAAGLVLGCVLAGCDALPAALSAWTTLRHEIPYPHHIPWSPAGISLRFAMVHDVLHERYPRHGKVYYVERNRLAREGLADSRDMAALDAQALEKRFALMDDLGAGLDFLGQDDEAVALLREKLSLQQRERKQGRDLYTTYANLGTFLIHGNMRQAGAGDKGARERVREGLSFIRKAIEVNPDAHFGRELWQAVAVEFALACMDRPELQLQFDMIGNRLDREIQALGPRAIDNESGQFGAWAFWVGHVARDGIEGPLVPDARRYIRRAGAEEGWGELRTMHTAPVPFDEPCLGIVGMWRLGGGANPNFALALGETMLRVGQRHIAWCAFERARRLSERVGPLPRIRDGFVKHCVERQERIESALGSASDTLRPRFNAELQYGQDYQAEYSRYEAERIADRVSIEAPHFYDDFHAQHGPIATPPGEADQLFAERERLRSPLPAGVLFAGVFGLVTALCIRRQRR